MLNLEVSLHSLLSVCMDPQSPNKLFATKYCFLTLGDDTSFFFFISLVFVFFCYFTLLLIFTKTILLLLLLLFFFMKIIFIFSCSGMFRVPGFIDEHGKLHLFMSYLLKPNFDLMYCNSRGLTEISKIQLVVYYQCCVLIG